MSRPPEPTSSLHRLFSVARDRVIRPRNWIVSEGQMTSHHLNQILMFIFWVSSDCWVSGFRKHRFRGLTENLGENTDYSCTYNGTKLCVIGRLLEFIMLHSLLLIGVGFPFRAQSGHGHDMDIYCTSLPTSSWYNCNHSAVLRTSDSPLTSAWRRRQALEKIEP